MDYNEIRFKLQSADEEIRRTALNGLSNLSSLDDQSLLFSAMGDESWRVRKEAVELYVAATPDVISVVRLLQLLRNEDNAGLRNSAAEAVIRLGSAAVTPLIEMVQDHDADVRKYVIDIMGAIGDPQFVAPLLHALNDPEVNVASAAAEQLGAIGDSNAVENLVSAVLSREEVLFRFSALGALKLLAHPVQVPDALIQLAQHEILKKAVFDCLGSISDVSSFRLLLNGFTCPHKKSRAAAVTALYKIYCRSASNSQEMISEPLRLLKGSDVIVAILELVDVRDTPLTEALIWLSVMTRDVRFIPLLLDAFTGDHSENAAFAALKTFGREAVDLLVLRYPHLDETGRSALCMLIAESGSTGFTDLIQEALHDQSSLVRTAATKAVAKLGLNSLIPDLVSLLDDRDVYVPAIASLQLLARSDRAAVLAKVELLSLSPAVHHRKAAVQILASLGDLETLLSFVHDGDPQVRSAAISVVGSGCCETSVPMLIEALTDTDADVRIAVADALGNIQDARSLSALEHSLSDEDVWVQSAALKAISKIDPDRARELIIKTHSTSDGLFMITSLQVLGDIGGSEAEAIIRSSLQSGDRDIARQAALSLARFTEMHSLQAI